MQVWCKNVPSMMPKSSVDVQVWCKHVSHIWSKSLLRMQVWCKTVPKMMPKSSVDVQVCYKNVSHSARFGQSVPSRAGVRKTTAQPLVLYRFLCDPVRASL